MEQKSANIKDETLINVRKLAALDIAYHGSRLILLEFAFAMCLCAALGLFILFRTSNPSPSAVLLGCLFLGVSLNYVSLLLYAVSIARRRSATQEVAFELAHKESYARKYTLQSVVLIPIPFALVLLSAYQEWQKHTRRKANDEIN